ncbi:hypothetical protein GG344DRAFT_83865 [Lentinula edodes]|nr:hypothetical protein GG344DRAFT_83865 [Lentinula edodes]
MPSREQSLNPSPNSATLPDFYTPRWVTSSIPFLGFAPSSNPFKFHFLKCLDHGFSTLPIEKDSISKSYALNASLQEDWDSLERNMRAFQRACMKINRLAIPEDFRLWPLPNFYGYHARWRTEAEARSAGMRSRQAFIPLIACISFFLQMLYHLENKWVDIVALHIPPNKPDSFLGKRQKEYAELCQGPVPAKWEWQELLRRETSISSEWLAYFHQIMDIPRVGAFVDVHNSGCLPWLPVFLNSKMPVMLYWGQICNWSVPKIFNFVIPFPNPITFPIPNSTTVDMLSATQTSYPPPSEDHSFNTTEGSTHKPKLRYPRITGGSLPRNNEDLFAFIQRREAHRLKVIASEAASEHQSRLQREENARRDRPPGRKGARVYYWDLVEGIRVRTARRYDSVADEWEICTDLDPDGGCDLDSLEDDSDDDYFIPMPLQSNEEAGHDVGPASSYAYVARLHPQKDSPTVPISFSEAIEDIAHHRFGFLKRPIQDNREIVILPRVWKKVLGLLGCGHPPVPDGPHDHIKLQIINLVMQLNGFAKPQIPFEVDVLTSYHGYHFLIQAQDATDNEPYLIALCSAATVLEIARRKWGPGTVDIIQCLIEEGLPFNTLIAGYPPQMYKVIPRRRPAVLGFHPAGFLPNVQDYHAYEVVRNKFLCSARGRAALLGRGIVARLAREIVNKDDVYDGPTVHALQEGEHALCVWEVGRGRAFWDDQLTSEETDLICGTYEIATGMRAPFITSSSDSFV